MNHLQQTAIVSFFTMSTMMRDVESLFPRAIPSRHQNNLLQPNRFLRWGSEIRTHFDQAFPERSLSRRFVTVIVPENLFIAYYLAEHALTEIKIGKTVLSILYISQLLFCCWGLDSFRKAIAHCLTDVFALRIINLISPRDCYRHPPISISPLNRQAPA